ncbi:MAG TPA: ComEC/Rec2 family competence protein [Rickettsiales bacterium]|nr:ComEC/Rec2 family competence protein [Rickettsiales bacterium]
MKALYRKLAASLESEQERFALWIPVCMGFGIAWYFHLRSEPPLWLGSVCMIAAALIAYAARRRAAILYYICIAILFAAFGVTLAQWRTYHIHSPHLTATLPPVPVSGKIAEIAPTPKGSKLILKDVTITGIDAEHTPHYISVTLHIYDPHLVTGQIVHLRAGLFPPPEPDVPGGFDFSRYFYFREIGAVGYGIAPLEAVPLKESGASGFDIWFAEFRHRLTESIRSYFREPAGSVAAAFITGETREIPESVNDDMRTAGLYHLLAVSGMNLSVVAGLAFFSLRLLFASIPALALRYPIKKWAALLALIASYLYLRVAGAPVSAERAFFMVAFIFIAILLDRDPMPMRSIAIAAFCIMLYEPEAVLSASFQLSFSATAALVASYEWGVERFAQRGREAGFSLWRIIFYFAAVMMTSLVAWLGTEPLIIYHFNQFSSYSLLANTVADPLVSFILMPLVIAGVLLLPFGAAWIAFAPMQYGIDLLLRIADWTAHLPHAMCIVPNPSDAGFALAMLGGIWVYFWKTRMRWIGLIAVITGMSTSFAYVPPDLFISSDGKHVAAKLDGGKMVMVRGRDTGFNAASWARAALEHEYVEKDDAPVRCDRAGCVLHMRGHTVSVLKNTDALADDCAESDVIIIATAVDHATCRASLIVDKTLLERSGNIAVFFENGKIRIAESRSQQGVRPWSLF